MRFLYLILSLLPAPLFLVFGVLNLFHSPSHCGSFQYEMTTMWFVMFFAHLLPWLKKIKTS